MEDILLFIIDASPFILSLGVGAVVVEIWERAEKRKQQRNARRKAERHCYDNDKISERKAIANLYYYNLIESTRKGEKTAKK